MTAGNGENADADLQARSQNHSALNRLFDSCICTARVARTGDACINRILQIIYSIEKAHGEWGDNIARDVHTLQHDMNVCVNETGQDVSTACIDFRGLAIGLVNAADVTN